MTIEVRSLAATYFPGYRIRPHAHPWGQLIYASEGVMRVYAADRLWVVPPERAVFAPPCALHEIHAHGRFAMRAIYLSPRLSALVAGECRAIDVSPLLRELVLHIVEQGMLDGAQAEARRLIFVLIDLLAATRTLPLSIVLPRDARARAAAERVQQNPAEPCEIEELAAAAGASARTLQRLFRAETGMRFSEWRRRLRVLHAVALIGSGASVTEAGLDAGYQSTSAFIAAFRQVLGTTPRGFRNAASSPGEEQGR